MVKVVLHEVVLGQILEVGMLDQRDVAGAEETDIHGVDRRLLELFGFVCS